MEIHLVVSKGPAVVEVEVPSLYGMKEEDARSLAVGEEADDW